MRSSAARSISHPVRMAATARTPEAAMTGPDLVRSVLVLDDEHGSLIGPVLRKGFRTKACPRSTLSDAQYPGFGGVPPRTHTSGNQSATRIRFRTCSRAMPRTAKRTSTARDDATPAIRATGDLAGLGKTFQPAHCRRDSCIRAAAAAGNGTQAKPTTLTVTPRTRPQLFPAARIHRRLHRRAARRRGLLSFLLARYGQSGHPRSARRARQLLKQYTDARTCMTFWLTW